MSAGVGPDWSLGARDFAAAFYEKAKSLDWNVTGLVTPEKMVYALGSDSKLIGRIFELVSAAAVAEIAEDWGFVMEPSPQQTVYPDFSLFDEREPGRKIAVDIKSTYRRFGAGGRVRPFGFTLGSYGSFLRNGTKNIAYPYNEYAKHYVIGFLYTRALKVDEGVYDLSELSTIQVPYSDVEFFVQEKHKIAGDRPGSGNTENIGTFLSADIEDFRRGQGPFADLGETVFEDYWRNYPRYRSVERAYTTLSGYLDWRRSGLEAG